MQRESGGAVTGPGAEQHMKHVTGTKRLEPQKNTVQSELRREAFILEMSGLHRNRAGEVKGSSHTSGQRGYSVWIPELIGCSSLTSSLDGRAGSEVITDPMDPR